MTHCVMMLALRLLTLMATFWNRIPMLLQTFSSINHGLVKVPHVHLHGYEVLGHPAYLRDGKAVSVLVLHPKAAVFVLGNVLLLVALGKAELLEYLLNALGIVGHNEGAKVRNLHYCSPVCDSRV